MGSLQEELKKQVERLGLVHPVVEEEVPSTQKSTITEQRKLAGIVETPPEEREEGKTE